MPSCVVKGCGNRSYRKRAQQEMLEADKKITFHVFPKDVHRRSLWMHSLQLEVIPNGATVCSIHFRKGDMEIPGVGKTTLLKRAVPYLEVKEENKKEQVDNFRSMGNSDEAHDVLIGTYEGKEAGCSTIKKQRSVSPPLCANQSPVHRTVTHISRGTSVSPNRIFNSPTKIALRAQMAKERKAFQKTVKLLRDKQRRTSHRVETLSKLIKVLVKKRLVDEDQAEIMEGLSSFNMKLVQRLKKKSMSRSVSTQVPTLKLFAFV